MENELKRLKIYISAKKVVDEAMKSFKFNLNLCNDLDNLNWVKLIVLLNSLKITAKALYEEINELSTLLIPNEIES